MKGLIFIFSFLIFASCSKEKRSERAAERMQQFVTDISEYAKGINPHFNIIPQNGVELAFNYQDVNDGLNINYMNAVDAFGIEELFYFETLAIDLERLAMCRELVKEKPVLVSEYISSESDVADAINRCTAEGFLCFPRTQSNYYYTQIPDSVINENTDDILILANAKNYLYLISSDNFTSKQAFLDSVAATNFDIVLTDLFFNDEMLSPSEVEALKTKANGGKRLVISYISIGSAENFRYYWNEDWELHNPNWLKKPYDGYEDEIWVKFWKDEWQQIIFGNDDSYMKKIVDAGFDGAYLDNLEAYYFLYLND